MDRLGDQQHPTANDTTNNVSHDKENPTKTEPRTGLETAEIVAQMYTELPKDVSIHLIEPSAVLTIAGMKGQSDIALLVQNPAEAGEKIDRLNPQLEQQGISLWYGRKQSDNTTPFPFGITNPKGYEFSSSRYTIFQTKFGIQPYDSATGMEGLKAWQNNVSDTFSNAETEGRITEAEKEIYEQGIMLGYPDQAIVDFSEWYKNKRHSEELVEADILSVHPLAIKYHGAVPEFDYLQASIDNPDITSYIQRSRQILKEFYDSPWMQQLNKDATFITERAKASQAWEQYLQRKRRRV